MTSDPVSRNSIVERADFATIQKVFDDIARETWFDDSERNLELLASLIMHTYQSGTTSEYDLLEACHEVARERFRRR